MNSTISNIGSEITGLIIRSKKLPQKISEEERMNNFLDSILRLKKKITKQTNGLKKLDSLFTELTWYDITNIEEEILLKDVIAKAKGLHSKYIRNYASMKKGLWQENICRLEISEFKDALDDFEESIYEVEEIFFTLRKDDEFNELMNSL